jgi:hypothetical protein
MKKPGDSKNTPGTDAAFDLLGRIAVDPGADERYPNRTVLIPADSPDASDLISQGLADRRPFVIVYPNGNEIAALPRGGGFALLRRLLGRPKPRLEHHTVSVPADYRVELRERAPCR